MSLDALIYGSACVGVATCAGLCAFQKTELDEQSVIVQAKKKKKRRATKFEASVRRFAFESVKKTAVPLHVLHFKHRSFTDEDHVLLAHLMVDEKRRIERLVFDFAESSVFDEPPKLKRLAVDRKAVAKVTALSLRDAEVVEIFLEDHVALTPENEATEHGQVLFALKRDDDDILPRLKALLHPYFADEGNGPEAIQLADPSTDLATYFRHRVSRKQQPPSSV